MKYKVFTLGDLVTIKYGKNQKKVQSEDGSIPIYGTGGLMGYATAALYHEPSVLIGRKGTINKVRYVDHPFWTVDTLFYVRQFGARQTVGDRPTRQSLTSSRYRYSGCNP